MSFGKQLRWQRIFLSASQRIGSISAVFLGPVFKPFDQVTNLCLVFLLHLIDLKFCLFLSTERTEV